MIDVGPIFDWLVAGGPGASSPMAVIEKVGPELRAAGVSVARIEAFVRTLHPHIFGRSFLWLDDKLGVGHVDHQEGSVLVSEYSFTDFASSAFADTPMGEACRTADFVRRRIDASSTGVLADLAKGGFTDFLAAPMRFLNGQVHPITFATRAKAGFSDDEIAALRRITEPIARIGEIYALARTAVNLLDTYVGRKAGARILSGRITRGTTDTLRAVIWFSDLRGFTELSANMAAPALIGVLNDLFGCQVPAIDRRGGEVLKFMGDGLLAIFPLAEGDTDAQACCDAALEAGHEAFAALDALNDKREAAGQMPLRFGLALHVGDVSYGNIGGQKRLDFTVIGPAVNVASRLEGLTGKLGCKIVVSEAFAALTTHSTREIGRFELKGVAAPELVLEPIA